MKSLMNTSEIALYLNSLDPYKGLVKNGFIEEGKEKCIGVYQASDTRGGFDINLGGLSCTETALLPINILVHWTKNVDECSTVANNLLLLLAGLGNIKPQKHKIYCMVPLDSGPKYLGKKNDFAEYVIRVNVYYCLEETEVLQ